MSRTTAASARPTPSGVPNLLVTANIRSTKLAKALKLPIRDPRLEEIFEVHYASYWPGLPIQGVYGILDTYSGAMYVGSSGNCHRRKVEHDRLLRRQKHDCLCLQDLCDGIDDDRWRFIVIEEVENSLKLTERERWWRYQVRDCLDLEDYRLRRDPWANLVYRRPNVKHTKKAGDKRR